MVKTELKRAFCSTSFRVTCVITLAMLAFGSSDYLPLPYATIELPKPWWIFYFHGFFLGMKTALPVFYYIVVMIPYVLSYRRDRDSGYRQLILLKTTRKAYLGAKALAVGASAFAAVLLPCLAWILLYLRLLRLEAFSLCLGAYAVHCVSGKAEAGFLMVMAVVAFFVSFHDFTERFAEA